MHNEQVEHWQHHHLFNADKKSVEKSTLIVVMITFITMIAEILFGWISNSMALLADGWHMGTHAFALGFVGLIMIYSSINRMLHPLTIYYNQALLVAVIGLSVNVVCAIILNKGSHAREGARHPKENKRSHHQHHHEDLNLKSAYLHVVADALTSVLAIAALLGAKYFNVIWLDPFMGIVGAGLIMRWSYLLLKDTGSILLQREIDNPIMNEIKNEIESDGDSIISDLHIWKVAQNKYACIVSLLTAKNCSSEDYKKRLANVHELAHVTIEVHDCK
ncbi:MAG: cation diffusion facilitator family transporter [Smithella sp.]|nr:cation diffusion facilitator family transporter [Smithella sp.]